MLRAKQGQSVLEYAILVAVVAAAFLAMRIYIERSIEANLITLENQINTATE